MALALNQSQFTSPHLLTSPKSKATAAATRAHQIDLGLFFGQLGLTCREILIGL